LYHFAVILHFRCAPSNVVVFLILGIIGLDAFAILLAVAATNISAFFSHCGADVKGGVLNCLFVTSEAHRWHHAADVPQDYGYSCNYGVEFSFWDSLFGTYYLPSRTASSSCCSESGG
jgi:sterol desaturase/sphingolipid hydroxylase (fatty acid hydroxylase superfamily)